MANFWASCFGCDALAESSECSCGYCTRKIAASDCYYTLASHDFRQHGLYYFANAAVAVDSSGGAENARLENAGLGLSGTGNVWNATRGIT